jgi:IMP dehydrogenase/GMP reductase
VVLVVLVALEKTKIMQKFDFNDILIKPAKLSKIESRKNINPFYNGLLPLITAPMDTVINISTTQQYVDLNIIPCLPRGEQWVDDYKFSSYSLNEIDEMIKIGDRLEYSKKDGCYLIDIDNGHMEKVLITVTSFKKIFPKAKLMVGNVANPKTYSSLSKAGADYIRVGIGNGGGCSTTVHTGVGYPMGSLISECYFESCKLNHPAKIVADGGMQNYSDIIKALALGADYVMVGSLLNKAIDSCGDNYLWKKIKVSQSIAELAYKYKIPVYKKFRGMSTKEVQKKWGKEVLTTSEGVVRFRKVDYTLKQWVENFEDYLRSAMSYSNAATLEDFIGKADIIKISNNAYNRFKK